MKRRPVEPVHVISMHVTTAGAVVHTFWPWLALHEVSVYTSGLRRIDKPTTYGYGHSDAAIVRYQELVNELEREAQP